MPHAWVFLGFIFTECAFNTLIVSPSIETEMVRASKWAFPRKAASAAPSCMVNVLFHFYCPKELFAATGISQSSQRGCWWLNESLPLLWCPPTLQHSIFWGSPPFFTNLFLPAAPLSLDFTLEIGLKPQSCSTFVMGKFFMGLCQTSLQAWLHFLQALSSISWGWTPRLHGIQALLQRPHLHHLQLQELLCCPCQSKTLRELAANTEVVSVLSLSCYLWKLRCLRLSQWLREC